MGFMLCLIIPVVVLLAILIACRMLNFSILPEGLKLPPPKRFKFPKLQRNGYTWQAWEEDSDDSDDWDSDNSDNDSDDWDSSDESSESEQ